MVSASELSRVENVKFNLFQYSHNDLASRPELLLVSGNVRCEDMGDKPVEVCVQMVEDRE